MISLRVTSDTFTPGLRELARRFPQVVKREIMGQTRSLRNQIAARTRRLTGELAGSFGVDVRQARRFTSGVSGSDLLRARFQEFGTRRGVTGSHVVERAVGPLQKRFPDRLARALREAVRRAGS